VLLGHFIVGNVFVVFVVQGLQAQDGRRAADTMMMRYIRHLSVVYLSLDKPEATSLNNRASRVLTAFMATRVFEVFSTYCIVVNVAFFLCQDVEMSEGFQRILQIQNVGVWMILCAEVACVVVAQEPCALVSSYCHMFIVSLAMGMSGAYADASPGGMRQAQSLGVACLVKSLVKVTDVRVMVETLLLSLPQLANIIGLL